MLDWRDFVRLPVRKGLVLPLFAMEWLTLTLFALCFSAYLTFIQALDNSNHFLYDLVMRQGARPVDDRIIIVAIDDKSLKALGRWPWSRETHAELLERLSPQDGRSRLPPKGVFLDLLLSEEDSKNDPRLAQAMRGLPKVVLPLAPEPFTVNEQVAQMMLPAPSYRNVAQLGYSFLWADGDGVARRVNLHGSGRVDAYGGLAPRGNETVTSVRSFPHVALVMTNDLSKAQTGPANESQTAMGIAWVGPPGSFMTIPYVNVLRGEVPPSFFSDRYVLIGATATGLGDRLPTPMVSTQGAMAGVEIHANILDGVLNNRAINMATGWQQYGFAVLPVVLAMLSYGFLAPRFSLGLTLALLVAVGAVSVLALRWFDVWLSPSAAGLTLTLAYLLWSWRRLEAVLRYFSGELRNLETEKHAFPELANFDASPAPKTSLGKFLSGDTLEKQITSLHRSIARVRNLRKFLNDGLENLPVALFITDSHGKILMSNHEARKLVPIKNQTFDLAGHANQVEMIEQALANLAPINGLDSSRLATEVSKDYRILNGKEFVTCSHSVTLQLAVAPVIDTVSALPMGWLFALVDLSAERQIQAHRADLLRFLSHDLRTPQVSILAMLELQSDPASALSTHELALRLGKQVRHTLRLTDDFLQLAKAEAHSDYKFAVLDLSDLVLEAVDQVWPLAKQKRIALQTDLPPLEELVDEDSSFPEQVGTWVRADGDLLRRAMVNLLHNAIRYSPSDTQVTVSVSGNGHDTLGKVRLIIEDQGIGIEPQDLPLIFERYRRLSKRLGTHPGASREIPGEEEASLKEPSALPFSVKVGVEVGAEPIQGLGLGLTQVKAVIDSHGGVIRCTSTVGQGTRFVIDLPWANSL